MFFTGDCSCSSPNSLLSELKISSPLSLSLSHNWKPQILMVLWVFCSNLGGSCVCTIDMVERLSWVCLILWVFCSCIYVDWFFFLYNIHLWFFWVRLSCVLVFDFLGLYDFFGFVFLCVLDEEDVRYLIMCCWFLIIFFHFFYFVKIDKLIFKILS